MYTFFGYICFSLTEKKVQKYGSSIFREVGGTNQKSLYCIYIERFLTTIKRLLKRKSTSCTNNGVQLFWFRNSWNFDCSLVYVLTNLKRYISISFITNRILRHTLSHSHVHIPIVHLCQIFDRNYKSCQKLQMQELI